MARITPDMQENEHARATDVLQSEKGSLLEGDVSKTQLATSERASGVLSKAKSRLSKDKKTAAKEGDDADKVAGEIRGHTGEGVKEAGGLLSEVRARTASSSEGIGGAKSAGGTGAKLGGSAGASAGASAAAGAATAGVGAVAVKAGEGGKKFIDNEVKKGAQSAQVRSQAARDAAATSEEGEEAKRAYFTTAIASILVAIKLALAPIFIALAGLVAIFLLLVSMVVGLVTCAATHDDMERQSAVDITYLQDAERVIVEYLRDAGLDALHIAAVMGNLYAESGYKPEAINLDSGACGIAQWLGSRKDGLIAFAESRQRVWSELTVQLDYLIAEMSGRGIASSYASVQLNFDAFTRTSALKAAVSYFCHNFERPSVSEWELSHEKREREAERIYSLIAPATGFGEGNARQQAVGTEAVRHPKTCPTRHTSAWPDTPMCLGWVTHVYESVGIHVTLYNSAAEAAMSTTRYLSKDNIPLGAVVFGSPLCASGLGHIGISLGGGLAADQNHPQGISLEAFIAGSDGYGGTVGWGGWGWMDNINLSLGG